MKLKWFDYLIEYNVETIIEDKASRNTYVRIVLKKLKIPD